MEEILFRAACGWMEDNVYCCMMINTKDFTVVKEPIKDQKHLRGCYIFKPYVLHCFASWVHHSLTCAMYNLARAFLWDTEKSPPDTLEWFEIEESNTSVQVNNNQCFIYWKHAGRDL